MLRILTTLTVFTFSTIVFAGESDDGAGKSQRSAMWLEFFATSFFQIAAHDDSMTEVMQVINMLPSGLLDMPVTQDMVEIEAYKQDHSDIIKTTYSPGRQALHYLLHKFEYQHGYSRSAEWRDISGWQRSWHGLSLKANNQDRRGYAEPHGLKSPGADFITSAEHFIMPPISTVEASIKCRIPLKYRYLKVIFSGYISPLERVSTPCQKKSEGMLDDMVFTDPNNGKQVNLGPINENTVLGFELLYATPGTGDASEIAGHLLLRVKLDNNPRARRLGIENSNDLVISFLADTSAGTMKQKDLGEKKPKVQIECSKNWWDTSNSGKGHFEALNAIFQSLKGLSGGFLTMMDRQTLAETIKNYTIEEDRDLLRYELKLDNQQKRNLLEQLYRARKNYNASYYFFYQNCASVLVKVIGQGIESEKIARFSPVVSPPNSLVALFVREGIADPIRPAFFSYRKKAYLAQDLILKRYQKIMANYSELSWPDIGGLFNPQAKIRAELISGIGKHVGHHSDLDAQLFRLFVLVQEAEMAFEHKDLLCEKYTPEATALAREYQQELMQQKSLSIDPIASDELFADQYVGVASDSWWQGVPHTKLLAYTLGAGNYRVTDKSHGVLSIAATLDEQELGSLSNVAMQRGSYVKLASARLLLSPENDRSDHIQAWRFIALDVRKFRDRLNRVPDYFSYTGSMGFGLSLLNLEKDTVLDIEHGSWIGGELLFNIASTAENNNFLYTSIGADYHRHKVAGKSQNGIVLPVRVETLGTFGEKRRWQWRTKLEYRHSLDADIEQELDFSTGLTYRLGEYSGKLLLLRLGSEYKKYSTEDYSQMNWIGVEINSF